MISKQKKYIIIMIIPLFTFTLGKNLDLWESILKIEAISWQWSLSKFSWLFLLIVYW